MWAQLAAARMRARRAVPSTAVVQRWLEGSERLLVQKGSTLLAQMLASMGQAGPWRLAEVWSDQWALRRRRLA
jgi:hypothetical protein